MILSARRVKRLTIIVVIVLHPGGQGRKLVKSTIGVLNVFNIDNCIVSNIGDDDSCFAARRVRTQNNIDFTTFFNNIITRFFFFSVPYSP